MTNNNQPVNHQVRLLARELQNVLKTKDTTKEDVYRVFDVIGELLGQRETKTLSERFPDFEISEIKRTFRMYHYAGILECMTVLFSVEFTQTCGNRKTGFTLDDVFLKGEGAKEPFCVLCKVITENRWSIFVLITFCWFQTFRECYY